MASSVGTAAILRIEFSLGIMEGAQASHGKISSDMDRDFCTRRRVGGIVLVANRTSILHF